MLLMRVVLPPRPGALGALATALGSIGADINLVEIVEKHHGFEVDELILDLPSTQPVEAIVSVCDRLDGVQVQWIRNYPRGGGIEFDIELSRRLASDSSRAGEILVSAAPLVFRAGWSVLIDTTDHPRIIFSTPAAPPLSEADLVRFSPFESTHRVRLPDGWLVGWPAQHAMVARLSEAQAVVVGREGEPAFFGSELVRLSHLVGATHENDPEAAASAVKGGNGHRHPIAPPLYTRAEPL